MIGKIISHYRILEKLGEGGMGIVYKAHDTQLDRDVALKFLPHTLTSDPSEKERFYHEARAAAALTHQNIAVVHEIGEHEGQIFIAMECIGGETLKQVIQGERLSLKQILDIVIQICDGLAAAHEKGIVHRDIKPENLMVTSKGQVKITDFGLAKLRDSTKITKTGSTLGTMAYMSPEQTRGEKVDHRSDIWSLGVVLYEMITGRPPFKADYEQAVLYSILDEEPAPLARYNEKITDEIQHIVSKALEKDRDDRYQHVDDMLADLRRERKHMEYARTGHIPTLEKPAFEAHPPAESGSRVLWRKQFTKIFTAIGIAAVVIIALLILRPLLLGDAISSERRTVAVISFMNQTGDESYDYLQDAIPNLLITNLEQSKYIQVATWERLYDLRKQIGKADEKIIDRDTGFELCKIDDIEAIVLGTFTKAGDVFATDVKVLDVRTKELLRSANSKGEGVGSILKTQIDELSKDISKGIGLSERKIEATPMQIAARTTESMEAYNYCIRGIEDYHKFYFEEALNYLQKAISIDSTFAVAYVYLGFTYQALNESKASIAAYQKAARYSYKTPEKERLMIEGALAANVENNKEKSINLLTEVTGKYPKDKWAHYFLGTGYQNWMKMLDKAIEEFTIVLQLDPEFGAALNQLGYIYAKTEEFEKAVDCFQRYAAVSPGDANPYDSIAELYFRMGRLDESINKYKEALDIKPDFGSELKITYIYLLKEDVSEALVCTDGFIARTPFTGEKAIGYWMRAVINCYGLGKLQESLRDLDKVREFFAMAGNERWIALADLLEAWIWYDRNETEKSRLLFRKFFDYEAENTYPGQKMSKEVFVSGLLALKEGNISHARSRLVALDSLLNVASQAEVRNQKYRRDLLFAEILITGNETDQAIRVIEKMELPELPDLQSSEALLWYNSPPAHNLAARAYIKKGDLDRAVAEYEKITVFDPDSPDRRLIYPRYRYSLAKLYEQQELDEKAVREYERFLTLWKDADPDLTEIKDARLRLTGLKAGQGK